MQSRSLESKSDDIKQWFTSRYLSPLYNPFAKVRCPFCTKKSYPGHAAVVYKSLKATRTPPPLPPTQGWRGFLARCWVTRLGGEDNLQNDARRQCPYCKELWPPLIERAENHIIAVLGARGSGKSCYIAVTIEALMQATGVESLRMSNVRALSDEVAQTYEDTYSKYLRSYQPIPPTLPGAAITTQPLMYEATFQKASDDGSDRQVNLIFYDVPGEMLSNTEKAVQELPFLFCASAVIYFADPLAIDSVLEYWKKVDSSLDRPEAGVADVLRSMIPALARARSSSKFRGPVAIALSKSDLVEVFRPDTGEDYKFANRPAYEDAKGKIRRREFAAIDKEILGLLKDLDEDIQRKNDLERLAHPLLAASTSFPKKMFFAVSATGCRATNGIYKDFQPRRCLDPLFWILSELGIIEMAE